MTEPWGSLRIDVVGDEIIVFLPGSSYSVKPANSPQLLARRISDQDDRRVPMTLSEFLARAWKAANTKARELGWIVLRNVRLWHIADIDADDEHVRFWG